MKIETEHYIIVAQPKPFRIDCDKGKLELLRWYEELYLQGYEFIEVLNSKDVVVKKSSTFKSYIKYFKSITNGIKNEKS
jgi:hypothetical protein